MQSVEIELPYPPSVNHYWRMVKGVELISAEGRRYCDTVKRLILAQRVPALGEESLAIEIVAHPPDRRRRDIDNLLKVPLDALCKAGVYTDDSQVDDLHIWRGARRKPNGCIVVRITCVEAKP